MSARALVAALVLAAACGGRSTRAGGSGGTGAGVTGTGGASAGLGGRATGTGGASGGPTGEDACAPLGTDASRPPARKGCYTFQSGRWVRNLCGPCELPIENGGDEPVELWLTFTVELGELTLSFTESPRIDVVFDDRDGRYFDTWSKQPQNGSDFLASREGLETHVTLGAASVALDPVTLNACEARYSMAFVDGPAPLAVTLEVDRGMPDDNGNLEGWWSTCGPMPVPPPSPRP